MFLPEEVQHSKVLSILDYPQKSKIIRAVKRGSKEFVKGIRGHNTFFLIKPVLKGQYYF